MEVTELQTIGLVLRRFDYGDTSQICHMLTPAEGRISVLGKGIKKPNAYLKGPFDLFQVAKITFRKRSGSDLSLLQKYEPITGFSLLRTKLSNLLAAFYLIEVLYEGVREEDPNPMAFEVIVRALGALEENTAAASRGIVIATELVLLESFGFGMALDHCTQCERKVAAHPVTVYPMAGGIICKHCPSPPTFGTRIESTDRQLLAALHRAGPGHAHKIQMSKRQHATLRGLMRQAFHGVFEKPLKSEPFALDPKYGFLPHLRGSARPATLKSVPLSD
ncbi:MAG: DNA repair protein RecO [Planctomycetota bacterium]|jgi:DNA repair protein RecO